MDLIFIADDIENPEKGEGKSTDDNKEQPSEVEVSFPLSLGIPVEKEFIPDEEDGLLSVKDLELEEEPKTEPETESKSKKITHISEIQIPGNGYSEKWAQLNELFLRYYPGEEEKKIYKDESVFLSDILRKDYQEISDKIGWTNPDESLIHELNMLREQISQVEKLAPVGYLEFLKEAEYVSPTLEKSIANYPYFFEKFPIGYWTDEFALGERHLSLLEFAYKIKEYLDYPNKKSIDLYKTDVKDKTPFLKLKIGVDTLAIEKFWTPQILNAIYEDLEKFFIELSPYYGFEIDISTYPQLELKKKIRLYMRDNVKVKGEKTQAYIVGNLIEILKWPNAKEGSVTTDSAEFIFRFLKIFDLDEGKVEEIDKSFAEDEKDKNGKPVDGSSYNRRRNEVFQRCRVIKNTYDNLI